MILPGHDESLRLLLDDHEAEWGERRLIEPSRDRQIAHDETEVIEHRTTGKNGNLVVQKVPGALKWSNIVLRRGLTDNMVLHDWRKKIEEGQIEANRKNGSIVLLGPDNNERVRYNFVRAWPCKFKGPALDASKNEIAIEEMEIAHEGLVRAK